MEKLPFEEIERKIIVKSKAAGRLGIKPQQRAVKEILNYGIVNIDKPAGPTSHNVAAFVQKILEIGKTGHSGTLDPAVTGCLPVALGRATRVTEALLSAGKEYVCVMHVHQDLTEEQIKEGLKNFVGKIRQTPPKKSAVKREERERHVYYIIVLEIKGRDVLFKIGCEAGTYIRMICHDFGQFIKAGAHMKELRRTKAGPFNEETLCTLYELKDAYILWKEKGDERLLRKYILPVEKAVEHLPKVWILDKAVKPVSHGRDPYANQIAKLEDGIREKDRVAVLTLKGELLALGNSYLDSESLMKKDSVPAIKIDKVFSNQ